MRESACCSVVNGLEYSYNKVNLQLITFCNVIFESVCKRETVRIVGYVSSVELWLPSGAQKKKVVSSTPQISATDTGHLLERQRPK